MNDKEQVKSFNRPEVPRRLDYKLHTCSLYLQEFLLHFHEVGEGEGQDDDDES
jgi:hypothetical protein